MSVRSTLGALRGELLCSLRRREVLLDKQGPVVSFAFDDFPRSAYTSGGAILKDRGFRGTFYVAMGLMNTSNHLGEMFGIDDLCAAANDGHEIAGHTFRHSSARQLALKDFCEDVRSGQSALNEITGLNPTTNFAYPFGDVTLQTKQTVGLEMNSCRGITGGINAPKVDLNLLRANGLYGDLDQLDAVKRLFMENERQNGWLIFYTHDVRPNPSRYGCTPQLFEAAVCLAATRGVKCLPVAEVLAGGQVNREHAEAGHSVGA